MTELTSGSGWISSIPTVTASGTSTPTSPDSSALPLASWDATEFRIYIKISVLKEVMLKYMFG